MYINQYILLLFKSIWIKFQLYETKSFETDSGSNMIQGQIFSLDPDSMLATDCMTLG